MRWHPAKVAIWALSVALAASMGLNVGLWVHREDVLQSAAAGLSDAISEMQDAGQILLRNPTTPEDLRAANTDLQEAAGTLSEARGVVQQEGLADPGGLAMMLQVMGWSIAQGMETPGAIRRQAKALVSIPPMLTPKYRTTEFADLGIRLLRDLPQIQARLQRAGFR